MSTAARKPRSFFPPMEQMLGAAGIGVPAYIATCFESVSQALHTALLCCHVIAFAAIVWFVFVSPLLGAHANVPWQFPSFFRRAAVVTSVAILLFAGTSWYFANHWSPDSNRARFAVTAFSCALAYLEVWGWFLYRRQILIPQKIDVLVAEGNLEGALELVLPRLDGAVPTSTDHLIAANLYWKLNQRTKAQSIFDEVLVRSNRAPIVLNNVASSYRSLERHLEALALIDEALQKLDAPMVELLINRCLSLIALGRCDEACDQLKLLEQQPDLSMKEDPAIQSALATIRSSITTQ